MYTVWMIDGPLEALRGKIAPALQFSCETTDELKELFVLAEKEGYSMGIEFFSAQQTPDSEPSERLNRGSAKV